MFKVLVLSLFIFSPLLGQQALAEIDFRTVKQSAELSSASYGNPEELKQSLQTTGYKVIHHAELPASAVSYYLAQSATGMQQLAFRGTANLENVLVDLDVSLLPDSTLGVQLHQGFSLAAKAVYSDVLTHIDKSKPIRTTGHSLGGAIAVIVGMYLQQDGYKLDSIITFGQPKVTNVAGAAKFESLPLTRVVTPEDIVPLVPPLSPLQIKNLDIYWHNGIEVILVSEQQYAVVQGLKSMMRATKFFSALPSEENLHAHQMATYLSLINSNQQQAKEVPYQTGLSLFGMSFE